MDADCLEGDRFACRPPANAGGMRGGWRFGATKGPAQCYGVGEGRCGPSVRLDTHAWIIGPLAPGLSPITRKIRLYIDYEANYVATLKYEMAQAMIPKHVHYVWVGGPLPDEQKAYVETWRRTNPGYLFTLWNEDNIDFSMPLVRKAYDQKKWAKVADIVRLAAVLKHGGIYLDTDFHLFKSLNTLLHHQCFFGFQTKNPSKDWVANGAFGALPDHWFIARALAAVLSMKSLPGLLERPTMFGPKLITKLLVREGLNSYSSCGTMVRDVYLCPTETFYPYAFNEEFHESCITPETLAVHHWSKSWEKDVPDWVRVAKSVRKRLIQAHAQLPALLTAKLPKLG